MSTPIDEPAYGPGDPNDESHFADPDTAAGRHTVLTSQPASDDVAYRPSIRDAEGPPAAEVIDAREAPGLGPTHSYQDAVIDLGVDREAVVNRQKDKYGGVKVGSAFFGWVAAAGIAVILTSLLTAAGVVLSLTSKTTTSDITNQAAAGTGTAKTVGLVGAILLLVVLFAAYYCGGYVAARMARFNGLIQGLVVWLWGIVFAIIVFVLVKIFGAKYNILTNLNLPRIPVGEGSVTAVTIIAVAAIVVVTLGGALLGGLAGMHFHRNVDRAGLAV